MITTKQQYHLETIRDTIYNAPLTFDDKCAIMNKVLKAVDDWCKDLESSLTKEPKRNVIQDKIREIRSLIYQDSKIYTFAPDYTLVRQYKVIKQFQEEGKSSTDIAKIMRIKKEKVIDMMSL